MTDEEPILPAALVPEVRLVELTHAVRRELLLRGEFLPPTWVEESAHDLRTGALLGWVTGEGHSALGFVSRRDHRAYAHVHVDESPLAAGRAERLLQRMVGELAPPIRRVDAGVTGLRLEEESGLHDALVRSPGWTALERWAMERPLSLGVPAEPVFPSGGTREAVRSIRLEALGQLDWVSFQGTPDAGLVAETPVEDERLLREILDGQLGRFLDEASAAIVTDQGHLIGLELAAEQSPQRAILLDLVVHPSHRRSGLGKALVDFMLRASAALGYSDVRLWVTQANLQARRLYERVGFRPVLQTWVYRFDRDPGSIPPHSQTAR